MSGRAIDSRAMDTGDVIVALVVVAALTFDFTNGFHDTANAMATTIATGALPPNTLGTKVVEVRPPKGFGIEPDATISEHPVFGPGAAPERSPTPVAA
jgi:hypothetical protein